MKKKNNYIVPVIIITLLGLSVLTAFGMKNTTTSTTTNQLQQTMTGTGKDFQLALDGDTTTAWKGSNYGRYAQITYTYNEDVTLKKVKWLLGSTAQKINYILTVRTSKDGIHWDEALPPTFTNYFSNTEWYEESFTQKGIRYIEIGASVNAELLPFEIYELQVNVE